MGSLWKRKQRETQEAAEARFNSSQTEPLMWRHRHPRSRGRHSWRVVSPGSILSHRKDRGRSKKLSSSLTFVSPPQNQFDPRVFTVNFNSALSRPDAGLALDTITSAVCGRQAVAQYLFTSQTLFHGGDSQIVIVRTGVYSPACLSDLPRHVSERRFNPEILTETTESDRSPSLILFFLVFRVLRLAGDPLQAVPPQHE